MYVLSFQYQACTSSSWVSAADTGTVLIKIETIKDVINTNIRDKALIFKLFSPLTDKVISCCI
jgi:hypothetical protein